MAAKKIYTLQINGITRSITETRTLREELDGLDASTTRLNRNNQNATQTSRQRSSALSEEEKAEQRLLATIDRSVRARTDQNRAQIEATLAAREITREVTREIQINNLAEGSIRQMGMQLTNLRNQYENLSRAQREDINVGGELLRQIQALDKEYKGLRESTGNFRDSVGNYEKATSGLGKLSQGIDNASQSSMGLAQSLLATNQMMSLFGDTSDENAKQAQTLQKILALLGVIQGINNNLFKSGVVTTKAATVAESIHTIQVRARAMAIALSTKNTIAATIAQKALNAVSKANPYVLLGVALIAVAGAVVNYATSANDATIKSEKYKSSIDGVSFATKEARDAHDELSRKIRDIQIDIDVATGKLSKYEAAILRVKNAGKDALDQINNEETDALEELQDKYTSFGHTLSWMFVQGNIFKGRGSKSQFQDYLDEQDKLFADFNERKKKQRDINAKEEEKALVQSSENIKKINEDNQLETMEGLKGTLAKIQTARLREEQNAIQQNKVIAEANKKRNKNEQLALIDLEAINEKYDKQRESAIAENTKKEVDAGKAAQARKTAALEKQKGILEKELNLLRKAEDDKTSLIVNEFDRRRAEVDAKYSRQREDLQKQIDTDNSLTENGRNAIRAIIANIDSHIEQDKKKIREDELKAEEEAEQKRKDLLDKRIADAERRNNLLLSGLDIALEEAQQKIGDLIVRNKDGLQLINVDATKANLAASNKALDEYIAGLKKAQKALKASHEATLKDLKEGTPEYEEELQKYAQANLQLNESLDDANNQREENTKKSNEILTDYFKELFGKIGEYAEAASMAISAVVDTFSMGLDIQIENLNEQLDIITEKYEEAKELREESVKNIEDLEKRLQEATGGTAEALKEQLQSEMHNRAELEREEAKLQKEKEKREAEIAKKEKQQKKADLVSNIALAYANTASAVIKALDAIPPPFNFALAALVGAAGAVQVGMMTKQLTKLEDGGLINGPSHANGGARIHGTNIEVEGGEYVVNKKSTAANTKLIEFINDSRSTVTASDLVGIVPGETNTPVVINNNNDTLNYEALAEAMANINISPTVAVTDIIDAQNTITEVRDLAGY